jgi:hypothetical protein
VRREEGTRATAPASAPLISRTRMYPLAAQLKRSGLNRQSDRARRAGNYALASGRVLQRSDCPGHEPAGVVVCLGAAASRRRHRRTLRIGDPPPITHACAYPPRLTQSPYTRLGRLRGVLRPRPGLSCTLPIPYHLRSQPKRAASGTGVSASATQHTRYRRQSTGRWGAVVLSNDGTVDHVP